MGVLIFSSDKEGQVKFVQKPLQRLGEVYKWYQAKREGKELARVESQARLIAFWEKGER